MIVRALFRRGKLSIREIGRLTFSQALFLLDDADPNDPHRGNTEVRSDEQLLEMIEEWSSL